MRLRKLVDYFGTLEDALRAKASQIAAINGFDQKLADTIADWENQIDLLGELRKTTDHQLTLLTQEDELYPFLLRQATHYGLSTAKKLSFQIAYAGYTVIRGLARGIDTAAHTSGNTARTRSPLNNHPS